MGMRLVDLVCGMPTGTYAQAQAVMGKIRQYLSGSLYRRAFWNGTEAGRSTKEAIEEELYKINQYFSTNYYVESPCPHWTQLTRLLRSAEMLYSGSGDPSKGVSRFMDLPGEYDVIG